MDMVGGIRHTSVWFGTFRLRDVETCRAPLLCADPLRLRPFVGLAVKPVRTYFDDPIEPARNLVLHRSIALDHDALPEVFERAKHAII